MAGNHKHIGEFDLSFSFWWVYKSWFGSWKLSWCDMTWKRLESYYLHLSTFQLLETSQNSGVLGDSLWFIPGDPQVVPTSELGWGNSDVFWANLLWHFKVGKEGITNSPNSKRLFGWKLGTVEPDYLLVEPWVEPGYLWWKLLKSSKFQEKCLPTFSDKKDAGPSKGVHFQRFWWSQLSWVHPPGFPWFSQQVSPLTH